MSLQIASFMDFTDINFRYSLFDSKQIKDFNLLNIYFIKVFYLFRVKKILLELYIRNLDCPMTHVYY